MESKPLNVGIRQFENTAIAKLEAEGVPSHVARAFVHIGLPKSGRQEQLKDVVCKMKYEKFFIERTAKDYQDPFRVGAMVPTVHESKVQKFYTEFAMSDLDAARFGKQFPEFDIISRGRTFNQHAYYANKRYAEAELLVSRIYSDANRAGESVGKIVDLGGNATWHEKRNRAFVHCDNPVMDARDIMRYRTREIFSSAEPGMVCKNTFSQCNVRAKYGMAVHATYDISPKMIAQSMWKRGMEKFFGVINYIPGIENKAAGEYRSDGLVMRLYRPSRGLPYIECGFEHDASLHYTHRLHVLKQYLYVERRFEFLSSDGRPTIYKYKVDSIRGSTIVFTLELDSLPGQFLNVPWSPPVRAMYFVSLKFLGVDRMEVDAEFFDRLVLHAAGSRNRDDYDIVSLYRYAKSLRQRVSINGIVLSSGYTNLPEDLVNATIAAFSVAAAYRMESSNYFQAATSQIMAHRGTSFVRDMFRLSVKALQVISLALPALLMKASGLTRLNERIKVCTATNTGATVEVYKPHSNSGLSFNKHLLVVNNSVKILASQIAQTNLNYVATRCHDARSFTPTYVTCNGISYCFNSRGVPALDSFEKPKLTVRPIYYNVCDDSKVDHRTLLSEAIVHSHSSLLKIMGLSGQVSPRPFIMSNGDRLYDFRRTPISDISADINTDLQNLKLNNMVYMVVRGAGSKGVVLSQPDIYKKGNCVRFVLLYSSSISHKDAKDYSETKLGVHYEMPELYGGDKSPVVELADVADDLQSVNSDDVAPDAIRFSNVSEGLAFVHSELNQGRYYMSGAINSAMKSPPMSDDEDFETLSNHPQRPATRLNSPDIRSASDELPLGLIPAVDNVQGLNWADEDTTSSEEIVPGMASMLEQVKICSEARKVALATSAEVIDFAIAASGRDAPKSRWESLASSKPGNPIMVRVVGTDWINEITGEKVEHMAVSDGKEVFDKITSLPPDGLYITSDIMKIYTGAAIKDSIEKVSLDNYSCPVTCIDGVAGSGKSYSIEKDAQPGDVVLCETKASLEDVARGLMRKHGWRGHAYTVDSFLMHRPLTSCNKLWIDEAFRLHAGKIFAVMKILKPKAVVCFGDSKQIPAYTFIPGIDFIYNAFPFISVIRKLVSYRIPADVAFALSAGNYYNQHVTTHNAIMRSFQKPIQYHGGIFDGKPKSTPLLVYTQTVKDELRSKGVSYVMTIGESQGKTFDDVMLYRDSELNKALYFDNFQTLVAVSRHRKRFTYVTVNTLGGDTSGVANIIAYVSQRSTEILLAAHLTEGTKPAADAAQLESRLASKSALRASVSEVSTAESVEPQPQYIQPYAEDEIEDWDEFSSQYYNASIGS